MHTGQRDKFRGSVSFEIAAMSFEIAPSPEVEPGKIKVIGDDLRQNANRANAKQDDITAYTNFIGNECKNCTGGEKGCIDPVNREDLRDPGFFGQKIWKDGEGNCYFDETVKGIKENGVFKSPLTRTNFIKVKKGFLNRMINFLKGSLKDWSRTSGRNTPSPREMVPLATQTPEQFLRCIDELVHDFDIIRLEILENPNIDQDTFQSHLETMNLLCEHLINLIDQVPDNLIPSESRYIDESLSWMEDNILFTTGIRPFEQQEEPTAQLINEIYETIENIEQSERTEDPSSILVAMFKIKKRYDALKILHHQNKTLLDENHANEIVLFNIHLKYHALLKRFIFLKGISLDEFQEDYTDFILNLTPAQKEEIQKRTKSQTPITSEGNSDTILQYSDLSFLNNEKFLQAPDNSILADDLLKRNKHATSLLKSTRADIQEIEDLETELAKTRAEKLNASEKQTSGRWVNELHNYDAKKAASTKEAQKNDAALKRIREKLERMKERNKTVTPRNLGKEAFSRIPV